MKENLDSEAINKLWQEYRIQLHRYVSHRVASQEEAEDIVHDVLVRVYSKRDSLHEVKNLKAWLNTVARNAIIDYYRTQRPMEPLPETLLVEEPKPSGARELMRCLLPLIQELPQIYREPLILGDLDGWPQKSVAQKLDLSVSGAKSRIQRGRHLLKNLFLECCKLEYDVLGHVSNVIPSSNCTKCGCVSNVSP